MSSLERKDVQAAVEARRELGPAYDDEIVDSLVKKIDERLAERPKPKPERHASPIGVTSLVLAIPLTAIAASQAGLAGILVVWIGIVLVNLANAARHQR